MNSEILRAAIQAEQALGENLQWLADKLDLQIRQGDGETLAKLRQMNDAWLALARSFKTIPKDYQL